MTATTPSDRVALVTGAARGIGAAIAVALARRGIAPVLLVREPAGADATRAAVEALGVPCRVHACDVADRQAVGTAVDQTLDAWGRIDGLVNNAGRIEPIGRLGDTDPADWARALTVNLVGAYHLVHAALPALLASPAPAIVNLSSGAAHAPREGWSAYCSSKAGLAMLTRCIAHEYGDAIATYGLQPGVVDTGMQAQIRASGLNEISRRPQSRLAPPARSAAVVAWLLDARPGDLAAQDLSVADATLLGRAGVDG